MSSYLAFNNPFAQPLHFVGLELIFVVCAGLTLRDVAANWRQGNRYAAFQWLAAFAYGILMELVAYNFIDNFWHAQFTVQLYHQKLPFYVICLYPVFLYTGLRIVERWRLPAIPEALLTGFAICLIDIPFDIAGVDAGWWSWSAKDPNVAVRWLGVPVTSYYWYLLFGAIFALLCRGLRRRLERRPLWLAALVAPLVGAGVIVLGTLCFLPFHGLKALGVRDDVVVAIHLVGCAALLLFTRPRALGPSLRSLLAVPLILDGWHLGLLLTLGQVPQRQLKVAMVVIAAAASLRLLLPSTSTAATAARSPLKEVP